MSLWKPFVMDEKEYQKYCIGRWKCNACNNINSFSDSDRMRWFLFSHLNKARLSNSEWMKEREGEQKKRILNNMMMRMKNKMFFWFNCSIVEFAQFAFCIQYTLYTHWIGYNAMDILFLPQWGTHCSPNVCLV